MPRAPWRYTSGSSSVRSISVPSVSRRTNWMLTTLPGATVLIARERTRLPGHADGRAGPMVPVDVGDEIDVERRVEVADPRRPAGGDDHVRELVLGGEVHPDADLEGLVELEAEEQVRRRKEEALFDAGDADVADHQHVEPRVADHPVGELVTDHEAVRRAETESVLERLAAVAPRAPDVRRVVVAEAEAVQEPLHD